MFFLQLIILKEEIVKKVLLFSRKVQFGHDLRDLKITGLFLCFHS